MSKIDKDIALGFIAFALLIIAFVLWAWKFGIEFPPRGGVHGLIEELKGIKDGREWLKKKYPDMADEIDKVTDMEIERAIEKWGENS